MSHDRPGRTRPPSSDEARDITELLRDWAGGDAAALDELTGRVYADLKRRAAAHMRREQHQTLNPTDLVHEAYLRLVGQRRTTWQNRSQFFAIASQMMRRILVDRARARRSVKRSGRWARVTLEAGEIAAPAGLDVLDLDAALARLATFDARSAQLAELRFFAGLSIADAAKTLRVSDATANRDWQSARAWLLKELRPR